jgi:hypothetical protein
MQDTTSDARRQPQVQAHLMMLENELSVYEKLVSILEEKLNQVLMPISEGKGGEPVDHKSEPMVEMATRINGYRLFVLNHNARLNNLINRIEL